MNRMYLSPTASIFSKICLSFVEVLIGLYNLITFPIRKITLKTYSIILLISGVLYTAVFYAEFKVHLLPFVATLAIFTIGIFTAKSVYNILRKKVSPRVAYLINSPLGIPVNKYSKVIA